MNRWNRKRYFDGLRDLIELERKPGERYVEFSTCLANGWIRFNDRGLVYAPGLRPASRVSGCFIQEV